MIGAHLDSWNSATGATDNADGAATVLEAMRILKAVGAKPRRTIRVALWGGEEEGLYGSRAWVAQHLAGDANKAARDKFDVYFNIDPGYGRVYGFYTQGNDAAKAIFDQWLEPFKDAGAKRNLRAGIGNTDHLSFIAEGVPGFNPVQEFSTYDVRIHHTNMDTMERMTARGSRSRPRWYSPRSPINAAMRDAHDPRARRASRSPRPRLDLVGAWRTARCCRRRGTPAPDRHRRLAAAARDEARAVDDEQILHVVRAIVLVDDRRLRVVPHAARAEQVDAELLALDRLAATSAPRRPP